MAKLPLPHPIIPSPLWLVKHHRVTSDYHALLPAIQGISASEAHDNLLTCINHILEYQGSTETMDTYRTESNRFLNWLWLIQGKTLKEVRRNDVVEYLDFCLFPPKAWICEERPPQFFYGEDDELIANPEWRPFGADTRARSSVDTIFSRLSSLFQCDALLEVIGHNPVQAIRQKNKYRNRIQGRRVPKVITKEQTHYCFEVLEDLCHKATEPRAIIMYERALFAFTLALSNYLRISEFVDNERSHPVHGDFERNRDGHWYLRVVGKGDVERDPPISNEVLEALMRWRDVLGLTPLPAPGDTTPMFPRVGHDEWDDKNNRLNKLVNATDTVIVWKTFRGIFRTAYQRMLDDNKHSEALELVQASAHWLRHTGITRDIEHRPIEHIRDDAGHSSTETTMQYVDATHKERAASKSKVSIRSRS